MERKSSSGAKQKSSKILVRNVPFEATQKELRELFGWVYFGCAMCKKYIKPWIALEYVIITFYFIQTNSEHLENWRQFVCLKSYQELGLTGDLHLLIFSPSKMPRYLFILVVKKRNQTLSFLYAGVLNYAIKMFSPQRAFKSLCTSTHLYGRRLVLEWAEDNESIEELRKKTSDYFHERILLSYFSVF